jgi:putative ABC transport system ATP-binding protein
MGDRSAPLPPHEPPRASAILGAWGLRKAFGPTVALAEVSLTLLEGEILAILGPSGAGKSTLLLCLAGILDPDQGDVRFRDRSLPSLPDAERSRLRRREFGFVFQLGQLLPELTAVENAALPLLLEGVGRRAAASRALELLEELGVHDVAEKRPGDMSAGQVQRVAVARALIGEPAVIFADEPTGALDSRNARQVMDLLVQASRARGAAILLVTHDGEVAARADRRITLRDGRIAGSEG